MLREISLTALVLDKAEMRWCWHPCSPAGGAGDGEMGSAGHDSHLVVTHRRRHRGRGGGSLIVSNNTDNGDKADQG